MIKPRRLRCTEYVGRMEDSRSVLKILIHKPAERRYLGIPGHGWEDNIKIDLQEIGVCMRNWKNSAQNWGYWRLVMNVTLNL